jgi:putative membrane protein
MSSKIKHLFSEADMNRVKAAVAGAEQNTSAEIVPYVVDRSDDYEEAEWRSGALFGSLVLAGVLTEHFMTASWLPIDFAVVLFLAFASFLFGMALAKLSSPAKRLFAGKALMERRVGARASQAFMEEKVFETRGRTGILIFISVLEHEVVVLGDEGINAKVQQSEWQDIVATVVKGIRSARAADGLVEAIAACGLLLERTGVKRDRDDSDELSDNLRVRER